MKTNNVTDKMTREDLKFAEELLLQVLDYLTEDEHTNPMFDPKANIIQAIKKLPINNSIELTKYC